jgi:YesN/AraC family two-component response regulator
MNKGAKMYRILVADDEPIERLVIDKKVKGFFPEQVEIFLAENGIRAVEMYEENNCQIAILDIAMPGKNGLDAAAEIKRAHPESCIIFLTAFDEFNYAKRAIEIRALDYLLKPGSDEDLINVLEEAFHICDKYDMGQVQETAKEPLENPRDENDAPPNVFVGEVRDYIEKHYKDDMSLLDVAGNFGYSDVYFCKLFKQNFGKNFITFLNEFRMDKAKELLANPAINIKDISALAGYRDANYFTRVFKRMTGKTPSEYRSGVTGV